jgi:predicted CxxxxCH...CXXCH cytochrome family protein
VNCHDPHGDGTNIAMMQRQVFDKEAFDLPTQAPPALPTEQLNLIFTDNATGVGSGSFAWTTTMTPNYSGICQECHEGTTPGTNTTYAFVDGVSANVAGHASNSGDCSGCHRHDAAFKPPACANTVAGCHGTDGARSQPDGSPGSIPDRRGRHDTHIAASVANNPGTSANDESTCNWCHPGGAHSGGDVTPAEVMDGTTTHFKDIKGVNDSGDGASQAGGNISCSGLECHYRTTMAAADWYGSLTMSCAYCHQSDVAYNQAVNPLPNAHTKHVAATGAAPIPGYAYPCSTCHPNHGSTWAHEDGDIAGDVVFGGVPWGNGLLAETVSGGNGLTKYGTGTAADYSTCNGISCHGDYDGGNNGDGGTATNAPNWFNTVAQVGAGSAAGRCGTCHGTVASLNPMPANTDGTPKANRHAKHVTANGYTCQECHYNVTSDGATVTNRTLHSNGAFDAEQAASAVPLRQFTWSAPNCTSAACHGGVSVSWATTSPLTCDVCHSNTGGSKTGVTDVNNWAWDNTQSKVSDQTSGEYATRGHGVKSIACGDCHDSALAHDPAMTTNPFRLMGGAAFSCSSSAANCHDGSPTATVATVTDHTSANMSAAGYTPNVDIWGFVPKCIDCHDPHGDGSNLRMIHADLWDLGSSNTTWLPTNYLSIGNTNVVFTDESTGVGTGSYAEGPTNYSGLCQECHVSSDLQFTSFKDGSAVAASPHPSAPNNPGDCTSCHPHKEAFRPYNCEDCHNGNPGQPLAPNIMNGQMPINAAVSYNWPGLIGTKQDGGHGDPQGQAAVSCVACHDLTQPAPGDLHGDGIYQSIWNNITRNANTAHLKAEWFDSGRGTPTVRTTDGEWTIQVNFDFYCAEKCHPGAGVQPMIPWHQTDTVPADGHYFSNEFGTHMTITDGDAATYESGAPTYPVDADLNTGAAGGKVYMPCIGCHDPHGTTVVEPSKVRTYMMRDRWIDTGPLCGYRCHQ